MRICQIEGCDKPHGARGYCAMHDARIRRHGDPHAGQTHAAPEIRFWRYVDKTGGCWIFRQYGEVNYGRFKPGGRGVKTVLAHRYSYEIHHGPIPDGMVVMHSCDNRACVNPEHLSLGTYKENTAQMTERGRHPRPGRKGEASPQAKLDEAAVRHIRSSSESHAALSRQFGCRPETIRSIRIGRTWSHVT